MIPPFGRARTGRMIDAPPYATPYDDAREMSTAETNEQAERNGATTMNMDTFMMIARAEQEQRIKQAAKYNFLQEAEAIQRAKRPGRFSRRTRNAQ